VIVADACVTLLLIVQELPEPLVMYVPAGIVPPVKYIPTDIVPVTPPTVNVVPAILLLVIVATSCVVAVAVPVSIGLTGYASVKSTNLHLMRGFSLHYPGIFFCINPIWFPKEEFSKDAEQIFSLIIKLQSADNGKVFNKDGNEWDHYRSEI
jgi:hypothetical protein